MNLDALAAKYTNLARPLGTTNASREKIKAAIRAALAQARDEALEEAAKATEPNRPHPPCDCIRAIGDSGLYCQECTCGNTGDLADAEAWCVSKNRATAIRSLKEKP